jgi:nucleotide-binding universal stress UspA family protein
MRIVLAIDGSDCSEAAIQSLEQTFAPERSEVLVLHVFEPVAMPLTTTMSPEYFGNEENERKVAQQLVNSVRDRLAARNFRTQSRLEVGSVKEKIVAAAANWNADLILLGSHGRKGLQRMVLGSIAQGVARDAHCSVQIVKMMTAAKYKAQHAGLSTVEAPPP